MKNHAHVFKKALKYTDEGKLIEIYKRCSVCGKEKPARKAIRQYMKKRLEANV